VILPERAGGLARKADLNDCCHAWGCNAHVRSAMIQNGGVRGGIMEWTEIRGGGGEAPLPWFC